jgi:hypothetical protein
MFYRTVRKKSVKDNRIPDQEQMDFEDWIRKRGYQKFLDFIDSMQAVATGLLWGAETLFAIVFVSFLASFLASGPDGDLWEWMIFSLMLILIFFILYKAYRGRSDGVKGRLWKKFQKSRPLVELIKFKRLMDLGVITKEDYEKEKKLILEKREKL